VKLWGLLLQYYWVGILLASCWDIIRLWWESTLLSLLPCPFPIHGTKPILSFNPFCCSSTQFCPSSTLQQLSYLDFAIMGRGKGVSFPQRHYTNQGSTSHPYLHTRSSLVQAIIVAKYIKLKETY
jgi:hypothetical protein